MSVYNMNNNKLNRKFLNNSDVSKHLLCIICQDLFDEPKRLNCGHTFCESCILTWTKEDMKCPICKQKIIKKMMDRDLIAFNIINDMLVACVNSGCPWKSKLSDLRSHVNVCQFDEKRMPQNVKEMLQLNYDEKPKTLSEMLEEEGEEKNNYFDFNNKNGSLRSRLFAKAPEMMKKVLEGDEKNKKSRSEHEDILSYLDLSNSGTKEKENINTNANNLLKSGTTLLTSDKSPEIAKESSVFKLPDSNPEDDDVYNINSTTNNLINRKRRRSPTGDKDVDPELLAEMDEEALYSYAVSLSLEEYKKANNN